VDTCGVAGGGSAANCRSRATAARPAAGRGRRQRVQRQCGQLLGSQALAAWLAAGSDVSF
jgi:hypothetical protein